MSTFNNLPEETRRALEARLSYRIEKFKARCTQGKILIVGDRPGPSRPNDPDFHHTPFFDVKHCSLWLNLQLHEAGIPEESLRWVNAGDMFGRPTDYAILHEPWELIVLLGGRAGEWAASANVGNFQSSVPCSQMWHPQAWKRFRGKEPYPLIQLLKERA